MKLQIILKGDERNQIPRPLYKQTPSNQPSCITMELIQNLLNAQHTGCQADIRLQQSSYAYLIQAVRTTVSWYATRWQNLLSHHRLGHNMSNTSGRLTSRSATPLGDPRGVPKRYRLRQRYKSSKLVLEPERLYQLIFIIRSIQPMQASEIGSYNTGTQQLFTGQTSFKASQTGFETSENIVHQQTNIDIRNLLESYAETNSVETNSYQQLYVNTLSTTQSCQYVQTNIIDQSQDYQVYSISPMQQPLFVINPIVSEEQTGNFAPVFINSNPNYLSPEASYSHSSSHCSPTSGTVSDSQTSSGSQSPSSSNGGFSDCSLSPSATTESASTSKKYSKTKRNYKNPEKVKEDNLRACERYREKKKRAEEALKKEHAAVVNRNGELKKTQNKLQQELIRLQTKIIMERITI